MVVAVAAGAAALGRQGQADGGASAGSVFDADGPVVAGDDALARRQADAVALARFGVHLGEHLEDAVALVGRDAYAVVRDGQLPGRADPFGRYDYAAGAGRGGRT